MAVTDSQTFLVSEGLELRGELVRSMAGGALPFSGDLDRTPAREKRLEPLRQKWFRVWPPSCTGIPSALPAAAASGKLLPL